ncbi:MAG: hypothetical protein IRZ00_08530 [Gemmatimonadetes bacterium]|nr:hypothetical protein [Gemmatimonadota bacterium]
MLRRPGGGGRRRSHERDAARIVAPVPVLLASIAVVQSLAKWASRFHAAEVDREA